MFEEHPMDGVAPLATADGIDRADAEHPGIESLAALLTIDPGALEASDAVRFLRVLERHLGWLHAIQARALVSAAGPQTAVTEVSLADQARQAADPGIEDMAREEVACATRWGLGQARHRIDVARALAGHLPGVMAALERGTIGHGHATAIADAVEQLPGWGSADRDEQDRFDLACEQLQSRLLGVACASNVTRTRRAAARVAAEIADHDPPHRRRFQRLAQQVQLVDDMDGLCTLMARMPAYHAHACMNAIRHLANDPLLDLPCDAPIGQRRAFALAALVIGPHPAGHPVSALPSKADAVSALPSKADAVSAMPAGPTLASGAPISPRPRVHLDVVITLDSLLGLSDSPGAMPGDGHIPAEVVRGLLADATMRRMVTDPLSGHLLDLGRRRYRVPAAVRRFIEARDQTCRFPGCGVRATNCEIDHAIPWDRGGTTSPGNLGALCTRHHRMKTHASWRIHDSDVTGSCSWTSPHGYEYRHQAQPPLQPVTTQPVVPGSTTDRPRRAPTERQPSIGPPPLGSSSPDDPPEGRAPEGRAPEGPLPF